jgi:uncharacterized membrane protein (UPF0136 family)
MILSGIMIQNNQDYGNELAALTSLSLFLSMAKKARTFKMMPLTMACLGLAGSYYYGSRYLNQ